MRELTSASEIAQYLRRITDGVMCHGHHWFNVVMPMVTQGVGILKEGTALNVRTYKGNIAYQAKAILNNGRHVRFTYHSGEQRISVYDLEQNATILNIFPTSNPMEVVRELRILAGIQ